MIKYINCNNFEVFAPLRGWYKGFVTSGSKGSVFAPLRGWYTKYITEYRKMEELNAWKIFTLLK